MPLSVGDKLGPYEILAPLGAGGMGEVWKARDTRLKREVAIKVLPVRFLRDADRMARFQREAEVLASLDHPNIGAIYGVVDSADSRALVLALVEGQTLADRVEAGPIPLDEAVAISKQIVEGLEYAHDRSIVHRDLKPANIKITPDGIVKVLDFGLAKALDSAPTSYDLDAATSSTLTIGCTMAGEVIGTPAYMSPEQVEGRAVDRRADIWSFGAVLFEILARRRAFQGSSIAETLSTVVKSDPDWSALPKDVPRRIQDLIRRCLTKDRKQRLQAIGEARIILEDAEREGDGPAYAEKQTANPPFVKPKSYKGPWPAIAAAFGLLAATVSFFHFREQPVGLQVFRYAIAPPEKTTLSAFAVSPDGHYLVVRTSDGLSVRSLDSLQAQPLAGTSDAAYPFWSADSRYIGFFAENKLKKISVNGGVAQALCDVPGQARGGTWNREGVILFASGDRGLSRITAAGGVPNPVTRPQNETHTFPVFLPDGRRFLYTAVLGKKNGIYLASLNSKENRRLVPDESRPAYFDGHLLFVRGGTLMAQPVGPNSMNATGDLFPIAEQIASTNVAGESLYAISDNGVLIFRPSGVGPVRQRFWFDRSGTKLGAAGIQLRTSSDFSLSPDEKRVVSDRITERTSDLWVFDLEHSTESRFTFDAARNLYPIWSPDGRKIIYSSNRAGAFNVYQRATTGAGQDELLLDSDHSNIAWDLSRDGRFLIYGDLRSSSSEMWVLPLAGNKKSFPLLQGEFDRTQGQLTPDGKWLAYSSNESGRSEVYVVPFAPAWAKPVEGKWQISAAGGAQPHWRGDGKEIFYLAPDLKLMAAEVRSSIDRFDRGTPHALFAAPSLNFRDLGWGYVPTADGKRFLIGTRLGESKEQAEFTVVVNWPAAAKK